MKVIRMRILRPWRGAACFMPVQLVKDHGHGGHRTRVEFPACLIVRSAGGFHALDADADPRQAGHGLSKLGEDRQTATVFWLLTF